MSEATPLSQLALLARVESDFFSGNPVSLSVTMEGQGIAHGGNFVLGCRAGPEVGVEYLLHEMAHLADRSIEKLLLKPSYGWGYYTGKPWYIAGQSGIEPYNDKAVLTEARCWAYQVSLMQHYNMPTDVQDIVDSVVYISAFWLYKQRVLTPEQIKDYAGSDKEAIRVLAKHVEELSTTTHTFEAFHNAWRERMAILQPIGKAVSDIKFVESDGGRSKSKRPSQKMDCVVRAFAIVFDRDYDDVYDEIASAGRKSHRGTPKDIWKNWLNGKGERISFPAIVGQQRMTTGEFCRRFSKGKFVVQCAKHVFAVVDGVAYDTSKPRIDSCVYAVWKTI